MSHDRYLICRDLRAKKVQYDVGICLNDHLTSYKCISLKSKDLAIDWLENYQLPSCYELTDAINFFIDKNLRILIKPHPFMSLEEPHPIVEKYRDMPGVKILSKNSSITESIFNSNIWMDSLENLN